MGTVWSIFYVVGLALPPTLILLSIFVVYRLASRARRRDATAPSVRKIVAIHVAIIVLAVVLGGFVGVSFLDLAAAGLVPACLFVRSKRVESQALPLDMAQTGHLCNGGKGTTYTTIAAPSSRGVAKEVSLRAARFVALFIGLTGILLPWVVGLGVKLYLQFRGRPTLPIEGFIDPASIVVLLILTMVMWSSPFLVLALLVAFRFSFGPSGVYSFRCRRRLIWWPYFAGAAAAICVFVPVFWQFDSMLLLLPIGFFLAFPMTIAFWVASRSLCR